MRVAAPWQCAAILTELAVRVEGSLEGVAERCVVSVRAAVIPWKTCNVDVSSIYSIHDTNCPLHMLTGAGRTSLVLGLGGRPWT